MASPRLANSSILKVFKTVQPEVVAAVLVFCYSAAHGNRMAGRSHIQKPGHGTREPGTLRRSAELGSSYTRVWQEAREEGIEKGIEEGIEKGIEEGIEKERAATIRKLLARGDDPKTVARTLEITVAEVRRLAKRQPE
jgi:hypothetical protein